MHTRAFLIDYPPHRYVGADLATHRHLVELGGTATVFTPGTARRYTLDGVLVLPWNLEDPDTGPLKEPSDVFVTLPYGSEPLRRAMSYFDATVKVLLMHSATDWTRACFDEVRDRFDLWVANSAATAGALGIEHDSRTMVLHPKLHPAFRAADLRDFSSTTRDSKRRPVIMMVNPIGPKGVHVLRALMLSRPDWRYRVVAGGYGRSESTALVATASRHGIPLELIAEQVAPDRMAELYATADVLVQPSLHESYGMTALEARTVGTPVAATDLPGVREALDRFGGDGVAWIPAPPDAMALEDAVSGLLAASGDRPGLRVPARA